MRGRSHKPCTRQANLKSTQPAVAHIRFVVFDLCQFARCARRPDFAIGAWRPQAQKVARNRLRLFDRRQGLGRAIAIARLGRVPSWGRAPPGKVRGGQGPPSTGQDRAVCLRLIVRPSDLELFFPRSVSTHTPVSDRPTAFRFISLFCERTLCRTDGVCVCDATRGRACASRYKWIQI